MWQEVGGGKKYKNETGNWEIFSWNEPTRGKGAFTCISSESTLAFSFTGLPLQGYLYRATQTSETLAFTCSSCTIKCCES